MRDNVVISHIFIHAYRRRTLKGEAFFEVLRLYAVYLPLHCAQNRGPDVPFFNDIHFVPKWMIYASHIKTKWILYHTSVSEVYHAALAVYHICRKANISLYKLSFKKGHTTMLTLRPITMNDIDALAGTSYSYDNIDDIKIHDIRFPFENI